MPTTPLLIAEAIQKFLKRPNPVLFAGAGIGCRVGYPSWGQYIEELAVTCEEFRDPESAVLIRKRLQQGNYLGAATVFKTSTLIPEGERWRRLALPFQKIPEPDQLDKLVPLVCLPVTAMVTTNYENSLHNAYAKATGKWISPVERDSLRGASTNRDMFVARIHGNSEQPTSMVVDSGDYAKLRIDQAYLDFLLHVFTSRSCLFIGFSFLDPAISHVLEIYAERFGPTYPALHVAVVPTSDQLLSDRLRQLNIEIVAYEPAGDHADLWRGLRQIHDESRQFTGVAKERVFVDATFGHGPIQRFVAFTYTQARLRADAQPVVAIAQDGVVATLLSSQPGGFSTVDELATRVASTLRVDQTEGSKVVESSLARLGERDQVLRDGNQVAWVGAEESALETQLGRLAKDVTDRACVREGVDASDLDRRAAASLIELVLMSRAWDIAAHLAGGNAGWTADVRSVVQRGIRDLPVSQKPSSPIAIERAIVDLFRTPDREEAEALVALGRAAFGIQLILASPRQSLFHKHALPTVLYLDASVLMPAVTTGHPLRTAYLDVIGRLRDAAVQAGSGIRLLVGDQFLNEIVWHRKLAVEMVETAGLEDPAKLRQHLQFHSAENTNVFVGAYGTLVGRAEKKVSFAEFLAQAAPYSSEEQLATYLERSGIHTVHMDSRDHNLAFVSILNPLLQAFEGDSGAKGKPKILIRHEAEQLTQLALDSAKGETSLFVTADHGLRRVLLAEPKLRFLAGMTVSHLGLIALTDVMVGLKADAHGLARLLWARPSGEQDKALFDYFVTLGLREYHEGLGSELQELAQRSADEASEAARAERVPLMSDQPADVKKTAAFLDRFEDRFYEHWREAVDRRERTG